MSTLKKAFLPAMSDENKDRNTSEEPALHAEPPAADDGVGIELLKEDAQELGPEYTVECTMKPFGNCFLSNVDPNDANMV